VQRAARRLEGCDPGGHLLRDRAWRLGGQECVVAAKQALLPPRLPP